MNKLTQATLSLLISSCLSATLVAEGNATKIVNKANVSKQKKPLTIKNKINSKQSTSAKQSQKPQSKVKKLPAAVKKAVATKPAAFNKNLIKVSRQAYNPIWSVELGEEDYQNKLIALRNIDSVYLDVDALITQADVKGVALDTQLKNTIIDRFKKAGLKLLTKQEWEVTPGQPQLAMYPGYPKSYQPMLSLKPSSTLKSPAKMDDMKKVLLPEIAKNYEAFNCCTMSIWTSYLEGGTTLREPDALYTVSTWGEGHKTNDCNEPGMWVSGVMLKTVDNFIAAIQKGQQLYQERMEKSGGEIKPIVAAPSVKKGQQVVSQLAELPSAIPSATPSTNNIKQATPLAVEKRDCGRQIEMYMELFATGDYQILPAKKPILQQVINSLLACPSQQYVLETHTDQRGTEVSNERLSMLRAHAMSLYFVQNGVDPKQFSIESYGERKPISFGNSHHDHSVNRRVVITPVL